MSQETPDDDVVSVSSGVPVAEEDGGLADAEKALSDPQVFLGCDRAHAIKQFEVALGVVWQ